MLLHVGEEHGNVKENNNCREEGEGWGGHKSQTSFCKGITLICSLGILIELKIANNGF
jgi:hypothetical protein